MASTYETLVMAQNSYLLNGGAPILYSVTNITSTTASVTLSVPPNYNNLEVVWRGRCSDANVAEQFFLRFNGDSTAGDYLWEVNQANNLTVAGTQSSATTATGIQIGTIVAANATANYFTSGRFTACGISDTNFKQAVGTATAYGTNANMWVGVYSGQWNSTAVVTSLTLFGSTGSLVAGSRFSLYVFN